MDERRLVKHDKTGTVSQQLAARSLFVKTRRFNVTECNASLCKVLFAASPLWTSAAQHARLFIYTTRLKRGEELGC